MNRQQLLDKLGISSDQLQDLMQKLQSFLNSLDDQQRAVVQRSLPSLDEAADAFGPGVDGDDLQKLFEGDSDAVHAPVILFLPAQHYKNRK